MQLSIGKGLSTRSLQERPWSVKSTWSASQRTFRARLH